MQREYVHVCLCLCAHAHVHVSMPQHVCGFQRMTLEYVLSLHLVGPRSNPAMRQTPLSHSLAVKSWLLLFSSTKVVKQDGLFKNYFEKLEQTK